MENPVKPVIVGKINGLEYLLRKDKTAEMVFPSNTCSNDEVDVEPNTGHERNSEIRTHTESDRDEDLRIESDVTVANDVIEKCKHRKMVAAVETRTTSVKVEKFRPLKFINLPDVKISPEEIKKLQSEDETLKRYMEMANQKVDVERQTDKIQ